MPKPLSRHLSSMAVVLVPVFFFGCASRRITRPELEALVDRHSATYLTWVYRGSTDSTHYLEAFVPSMTLWGGSDKYKISSRELNIPRTYPLRDSDQETIFHAGLQSLPSYRFEERSGNAILSSVAADGKLRSTQKYVVGSDGRCLAEGEWTRFDALGKPTSRSQYKLGEVRGRHWLKLDPKWDESHVLESYWNGRIPVGQWTINPGESKHLVIHFSQGREVLKEWYGASSDNPHLLLQRWKDELPVYKGEWVRASPPKLAFKENYLGPDILPDFNPDSPGIAEMRKLASTSP